MVSARTQPQSVSVNPIDDETIRGLKDSIAAGKHWYIALLESIGRWESAEETRDGRLCRYLYD